MVSQRERRYPALTDGVVERAAAHFRAQGAGVILLAHVENDLLDIRFQAGVGDGQLLAEPFHRREIHALKAKLRGYRLKLEALGVEALQMVERHEQQHAVLAAGDAHGDSVTLLYHAVIVHRAAHGAYKFVEDLVHIFLPWKN